MNTWTLKVCAKFNLKAGDCVDIRTAARNVIVNKGGIAKSADFVATGVRAVDVVNLCNAGYLDRVRHGYYQLAEHSETSEEQMLATLIPQGIVCVESALFHYGIAILRRASGPLRLLVLFPGQSWKWMHCLCRPITYSRIFMSFAKRPGNSMVWSLLFMTGSGPFVIALSIVPGWIMSCFPRPLRPMQRTQKRT